MKTILLILVVCCAFLARSNSQENRIWTYAKTGSTCEGTLQGRSPDGAEIQIKRKDNGKLLTVKAEMLIEEDQKQIAAWQAPAAEVKEANPTPSPPDGSRQVDIQKKLKTIVISSYEANDVTLTEAIDFLRLRCSELDETEIAKSKKGINFVITSPPQINPLRVSVQPRLQNIPAATLLQYIAYKVRMKVIIKEYFVELVPLGAPDTPELKATASEVAAAAAKIIIPRTDFENCQLDEAVNFFNARIKELALGKNAPVVILDAKADSGATIRELRVKNVSVLALVSYVASFTGHQVLSEGNILRITKK